MAQCRRLRLAIALCGLLLTGCPRASQTSAERLLPLAVIASGDTAGWIVPCGCTSKQDGGLLRRASYVETARETQNVVLVDVGGAPGGTSLYEQAKFAAILRGERTMGLVAHNLGAAEAALGADALHKLAQQTEAPFVSCNVRDGAGRLIAEPLRVVESAGRKIAIAGVLSPMYAAGELKIEEPHGAILFALAERRQSNGDENFDAIVVLAYLPEDELAELAAGLPEADLVLGGPTRQPVAPRTSGPTTWASATNKGKFLVHLALKTGERSGWQGEVVELSENWPDDERQYENLARFRAELEKRDFAAGETGLVPDLPADAPADFRVAGTAACCKCHADDCRAWDDSGHAAAWATLVEKRSQFDPYCQQCHTTGYGLPGGFASVARGAERTAVGCESCHGPSQAHAEREQIKTSYLARDRCIRCHDRENSPDFEFEAYWPQIEHGGRR